MTINKEEYTPLNDEMIENLIGYSNSFHINYEAQQEILRINEEAKKKRGEE